MKRFKEQAEDSGATFIYGKVTSIVKDNSFTVRLADTREYTGKTIILAYGKTPRSLGIPGEEEWQSKEQYRWEDRKSLQRIVVSQYPEVRNSQLGDNTGQQRVQ